jgi:hypothetical protein
MLYGIIQNVLFPETPIIAFIINFKDHTNSLWIKNSLLTLGKEQNIHFQDDIYQNLPKNWC